MASAVKRLASSLIRPLQNHPEWPPLLVSLGLLALYAITTLRTVGAYDSAELATGSVSLGIVHAPGYPAYLLLGHLFSKLPVGEVAFRINLLSGVCGAAAAGLLVAFTGRITGSTLAGAAAGLAFGLSLPVWRLAVVAEVYTFQALILAASCLFAQRLIEQPSAGRLAALSATFGLMLAHRPPDLILGIGIGAAVLLSPARRLFHRPAAWLAVFTGIFIHLLWYVYLPLRAAAHPALNYAETLGADLTTLRGIWWMVSGEMFRHLVFAYTWVGYLHELSDLIWLAARAWYGLGMVLGIAGIVHLFRRQRNWAVGLLLMAVPYGLLYAGYRVSDKDDMFLPVLAIGAAALGAGIAWLVERIPLQKRGGLWATALLLIALAVVNYPQADASRDQAAAERARAILEQAAPDAVIAADWSEATPLEYMQVVEGQRPDVLVFDWGLYGLGRLAYYRASGIPGPAASRFMARDIADVLRGELATRPVYSASRYPTLAEFFIMEPDGLLYRLDLKP
jgi:hypothetical protein